MRPSGAYPSPPTRYSAAGVHTRSTSISFSVSVPVLSEQMTVTDPSVSTAGSRADERVSAGHPSRTQREGDRDDGRQALRDGGDGEADRREEHDVHGFATGETGDEHEGAHDQRGEREPLAERAQATLERRRPAGVLLEQVRDPPERGRHPGRDHDATSAPVGDGRPAEGHVSLVGQLAGGEAGEGVGRLAGGLGLAGQRRLVDPQRGGLEQSDVGRDDVARFEPDEVARARGRVRGRRRRRRRG